jgi:hypothetical protein
VHEPTRVRGVERRGNLRTDRHRASRLERSRGPKKRTEVGAVYEPHREIDVAVDVAGVVDRNHIRVFQRHDELGLAGEALAETLVERKSGRDELDRDRPLQAKVVRPVHDTHPAAADQLLDPVTEEVRADVDGRVDVHCFAEASVRLTPGIWTRRLRPD